MPVIAPDLNASSRPPASEPIAACAVRTLARTDTFMPMKPAAAERMAPIPKPRGHCQKRFCGATPDICRFSVNSATDRLGERDRRRVGSGEPCPPPQRLPGEHPAGREDDREYHLVHRDPAEAREQLSRGER